MKRFAVALLALLFAMTNLAAKPVKVAAVLSMDNAVYRETVKGFVDTMSAKGMPAEKTDVIMDGSENLAGTAAKNELMLMIGTKAYDAAKKNAGKWPVVFNMVFVDPAVAGAYGAGVTLLIPADKKIAKIKEFLPGRSKLAVVYSAESKAEFDALVAAGGASGIKVTGKLAATADAFGAAVDGAIAGADCFLMLPDTKLYNAANIKVLLTKCMAKKIPVVGLSAVYTKAGAAFSIDYDYYDVGAQTAEAAIEYLNAGGKGKGKVASPRKFKTSVNSGVMSSLGITPGGQADQSF